MKQPGRLVAIAALTALSASALACTGSLVDNDNDGDEALGTARAALTSQTVEGESATGAGAVESDPTASQGQLLALTVLGSVATANFSTTGLMQSGSVRVRAACAGSTITVRIDGAIATTTSNLPSTWTDIPLSVPGTSAGSHSISFNYRAGTTGCALRVDSATIVTADPPPPPQQILLEAEAATGAGSVGNDPAASGGQYREFLTVYSTATMTFSNTAPLASGSVRVRSSGCTSPPYVKVTVDGHTFINTQLTSSSWTDLPLQVAPLPAGSHTVVFQYRYGPAGCALRVDRMSLTTQ